MTNTTQPRDARTMWRQCWTTARYTGETDNELFADILLICGGRSQFPLPGRNQAARIFSTIQAARAPVKPLAYALSEIVLNHWGTKNPFRAPCMTSPRFESWRRITARQGDLRKRMAARGMIGKDSDNNWSTGFELPATPIAVYTETPSAENETTPTWICSKSGHDSHIAQSQPQPQSCWKCDSVGFFVRTEKIDHDTVPPSAEIAPWQGAKAFHASRDAAKAEREAQPKKQRTAAHRRAIMAYLKFRAARSVCASYLGHYDDKLEELSQIRNSLKIVQDDSARWQRQDREREKGDYAKRRRAIITARDFQLRLYAKHDLVDRANKKHWKAREKMAARIQSLEAQIAATPVRRLMPRSAFNGASVLALAIAA